MQTQSIVRPLVWIGCLACYNAGRLLGRWIDAVDADEITPEDLHGCPTSHEELWCFDLEGFSAHTGELSPHTASLWGELFDELGEAQWPAFLAWVENGSCVVDAEGIPDPTAFEDRYRGCWPSFAEYLADEIEELQRTWPEDAVRYFDEAAYERDARFDYDVLDAPDGGVFIFFSC